MMIRYFLARPPLQRILGLISPDVTWLNRTFYESAQRLLERRGVNATACLATSSNTVVSDVHPYHGQFPECYVAMKLQDVRTEMYKIAI